MHIHKRARAHWIIDLCYIECDFWNSIDKRERRKRNNMVLLHHTHNILRYVGLFERMYVLQSWQIILRINRISLCG